MKRFVEGADRGQSTLLPECLDDWIDEKTRSRDDAFVDALDLGDLGVVSSGRGRVYFPKAPVMKAGAKSIPNWISGKASATFFGRGFFRYWSSKTVNGSLLSAGRPNVCLRWRRPGSEPAITCSCFLSNRARLSQEPSPSRFDDPVHRREFA